jgi:peptidylprolyl isomerase
MARYRRRRRLSLVAVVLVAVLAIGGLGAALVASSDSSSNAASASTGTTGSTTTTVPLESAAGKPCVAFDDTLPPGAPEVPIPLGPPPTELVSQDLVVGSGSPVAVSDKITVNYIGVSCSTGKIFDSTWTRGQPTTLQLQDAGLIQGWVDGIPGMQPGGQRLLVIPPDLGYGATGRGTIAPDETLVFVVELTAAAPATTTTTTGTAATVVP